MFRSFFTYPGQTAAQDTQDLVLLPQWPDDKWTALLAYTELRRFRAGERVIASGDTDRSFYIITEGRLEVLIPRGRNGQLRSTQVREPGAVIGEQAFIDGKPRSATICALTDGQMLRLSLEAFDVLAAQHPTLAHDLLFDLARILSNKLRQANRLLATLTN